MNAHLLTSVTEATSAYDAAIADAKRAYDAAIADAKRAYDAAIADAKRASDTKVAEAYRAHMAAWQALLNLTTPPSVKRTKTVPPAPASAPASVEPPTFTDDWDAMGCAAIENSTNTDRYKEQTTWTWKNAVNPVKSSADLDTLWRQLLTHSMRYTNIKTQNTVLGQVRGVMRLLGHTPPNFFIAEHGKVANAVKAKTKYNTLTLDECKELKCADGGYLTTSRLQRLVKELIPTLPLRNHRFATDLMCLALFAFHGNRPQDWCVGYGEVNKTPDGSYYCPTLKRMFLYDGKTVRTCPNRQFDVHPAVATTIAAVHTNQKHTWLVPTAKGTPPTSDTIKKGVVRQFFRPQTAREDWVGYGLPTTGINPTLFRQLWEAHIRHVEKWSEAEIKTAMTHVGHSSATTMAVFGMKYMSVVLSQTESPAAV